MADDKLKRLREKLRAVKAQIQKAENQKKRTERNIDTQRMVLIGRAMTQWAKHHKENDAILMRELDRFLTRNDQRAAFGLPPLPERQNETRT